MIFKKSFLFILILFCVFHLGAMEVREKTIHYDFDFTESMMRTISYGKWHENIKRTKFFLEKGVNINTQDDDGNTLLHYAVINGDNNFVEFLLRSGADKNLKNKKNFTPIHYAKVNGYEQCKDLLTVTEVVFLD